MTADRTTEGPPSSAPEPTPTDDGPTAQTGTPTDMDTDTDTDTDTATATGTPPPTLTPLSGTPPIVDRTLPLPRSPAKLRDAARFGGPPKDGIPSIDEPSFVRAPAVGDWLVPDDVVFGVYRGGAAKAYPQRLLAWHELCNDVVGGRRISLSYCPLTGTAMGFDRGETTFGVSGHLLSDNLVMFDRSTETWWPQILGTSIVGPWNDDYERRSLREFRVIWTTWERWRQRHPDTEVLTRDTGYIRAYNQDPYGSYVPEKSGYYAEDTVLYAPLNEDDRYHPKTVFMGVRTPDGAAAFRKDALRDRKLLSGQIGATSLLAAYDPGLDTAYVYRNPEGTNFEYRDGTVVAPDGSTYAPWAVPLNRVLTFDAMWFAWAAFYPTTAVFG